jgi:hypothetical protein
MRHLARVAALLASATLAPYAAAYNVYPFNLPGGQTGYSKWGDNHAGTPGGIVTWSLMPTGTTLAPTAPPDFAGTSNLAGIFNQVGGGTAALALIQGALDQWSNVANIRFQYMGIDDGTPFDAPYAPGQTLGDIRIGGFEITTGFAAYGYNAPTGGGTTRAGDIIINSRPDYSYYNAPGAEGDLFDLYPPGGGFTRNDFQGLLFHEIGHALGLDHSDVPTGCMCGPVGNFDWTQCVYNDPDDDDRIPINRIPEPDDVAGIQFLYGPPQTADFDLDDDVDGADYLTWQRNLGLTGSATLADGDANGDHNVSAADLAIWQSQFAAATSAAAVPEPNAIVPAGSLAIAAAVLTRRERRTPRRRTSPAVPPAI